MDGSRVVARHANDLVRLCYSGLSGPALQTEVVRAIHALLPVDAVFLATADPETLLFTGILAEEPLIGVADQFLANELSQNDVNKFQSLAASAQHVVTLDSVTHGDRAGSARYRDIIAPLGLGDELRAALVTPSGCWGYLCLHRAESPYGFTPSRGPSDRTLSDKSRQRFPAQPRCSGDRGGDSHCTRSGRPASRPHARRDNG